MFQGYGLGVAGEALTSRLRELLFSAMMQQVRDKGTIMIIKAVFEFNHPVCNFIYIT